jgi:hypothetical protein
MTVNVMPCWQCDGNQGDDVVLLPEEKRNTVRYSCAHTPSFTLFEPDKRGGGIMPHRSGDGAEVDRGVIEPRTAKSPALGYSGAG